MDQWYIAVILSIVEGLTEFLPVSSTGHLILVSEMLGFVGEKADTFNVVIQLGAICAVVVLYWPRFWGLLFPEKYVEHERGKTKATHFSGLRGIGLLMLTSLPACVLGLLTHSFIKAHLFTPFTVLLALAVGACVMIFVEKRDYKAHYVSLDEMTPKLAFGIGCFQCLALWPGFSRSASTIMGGMLLGCKRQLAAEYSFIAAVPIMVAATGYDVLKSWHVFSATDIPFFVLGLFCSFVAALIAIKSFVALVGRITLIPFAIYRLILAPIVYYFMVY